MERSSTGSIGLLRILRSGLRHARAHREVFEPGTESGTAAAPCGARTEIRILERDRSADGIHAHAAVAQHFGFALELRDTAIDADFKLCDCAAALLTVRTHNLHA